MSIKRHNLLEGTMSQTLVRTKVTIPLKYGDAEFISFQNLHDHKEHLAISLGNWNKDEVVNVRIPVSYTHLTLPTKA